MPDTDPPSRIAGACLGAAIPAITLLGLGLLLGTVGWLGQRLFDTAFSVAWSNLLWLSFGFAALGFLLGFDRLLALISPLWDAITWLWRKDRELDRRIDDTIFDYFFSILFCVVAIVLVWLWVMR